MDLHILMLGLRSVLCCCFLLGFGHSEVLAGVCVCLDIYPYGWIDSAYAIFVGVTEESCLALRLDFTVEFAH